MCGKSVAGRGDLLGSYGSLYEKLFSYDNQLILGYIGTFGFLYSILICGLKLKFTSKPGKGVIVLGLIGPALPFLVSCGIEYYFESLWELGEKEGFKGFSFLIFCFSFSSYPSTDFILQDLNLLPTHFSQFILSTTLIGEIASDTLSFVLNLFYESFSHTSNSAKPILTALGYLFFIFFIFRPLIGHLAQSTSHGQSRHVYVLIVVATAVANSFISFQSVTLVPMLVLGLAIPRIGRLLNLLSTKTQQSVNLLLALYITMLAIPVDIFAIDIHEKTTLLCGIIIITTTSVKFLTYLVTVKIQTCNWRNAGIVAVLKTPLGATELAIFSVLQQKKVKLIVNCALILDINCFYSNFLLFMFFSLSRHRLIRF